MLKLISAKRAHRILGRYDVWIGIVSARYRVPVAAIKAILFQEMTMIDAADPIADLVVLSNLTQKKDSSTGYGQIFGYVGLNAANFAVDNGLATYAMLGIQSDHRLDPGNKRDVRKVWKLLYRNQRANIELAALNLLCAAQEVTGRIDFDGREGGYSEEEMKLIFARYNANVRHVTPYGERAYELYTRFCQK